jgi:hypothetical protein
LVKHSELYQLLTRIKKNITSSASNDTGKIDFGWAGVVFMLSMKLGKMPNDINEMQINELLYFFGWLTWQDVRT